MNTKLTILLALILSCFQVKADLPPCWLEYSIYSLDSAYRADITFPKEDSIKTPSEKRWQIKVFDSKSNNAKWESSFLHGGYGGGILSNDGKLYVNAEFFMNSELSILVTIQTEDTTIYYSADDFNLLIDDLPCSSSNILWRKDFYLEPEVYTDSTLLCIETLNSKRIVIQVSNGRIQITEKEPSKEKLNNIIRVKILSLSTVILIGFGIFLLTLNNLLRHRIIYTYTKQVIGRLLPHIKRK